MRYLIEDRYLMEVVIDDTHGSFSADCCGTAIVKSPFMVRCSQFLHNFGQKAQIVADAICEMPSVSLWRAYKTFKIFLIALPGAIQPIGQMLIVSPG